MRWLVILFSFLVSVWAVAKALDTQKQAKGQKQYYTIQSGDTFESIADTLGVPVSDLKKWNPKLAKAKSLPRGRQVVYYGSKLKPQSVGSPSNGRLILGKSLDADRDKKGVGWVISAERENVYGTPDTIAYIKYCASAYRSYFAKGKAPPIAIGDISKKGGGPLPPHKSHQSGRDVDIGFIVKGGQRSASNGVFVQATTNSLDLPKQWVLTKCFLDLDATTHIFMEASIVEALKQYVIKLYKKNTQRLKRYLLYFPGGSKAKIVPDDEHRSHMHVRFACPKNNKRCIP
jgi:murein endopeptidase